MSTCEHFTQNAKSHCTLEKKQCPIALFFPLGLHIPVPGDSALSGCIFQLPERPQRLWVGCVHVTMVCFSLQRGLLRD